MLCPFPHTIATGLEYSENRPSAHYNTVKGLFHCKACGKGFNEIQFIENYLGCDKIIATKLSECFKDNDKTLERWDTHDNLNGMINLEEPINEETKKRAQVLGIRDRAIRLMHIKTKTQTGRSDIMAFPIDMLGLVLGHKYYNPYDTTNPKTRTSKKFWTTESCPTGLVYPWTILERARPGSTLCICAGEKDTANMLERGFQAVTVHGGEQTYKVVCPNLLRDKSLAILYDNDSAGIAGAHKLAAYLYSKGCKKIRIVTGHHNICTEEHEDITDFFMKYNKEPEDLKEIVRNTPFFEPTIEDIKILAGKSTVLVSEDLPLIKLYDATLAEYEDRLVKSLIQVVASEDVAYSVPQKAEVVKIKEAKKPNDDDWNVGDTKEWCMSAEHCEDILHLVDENFTETKILENIKVKLIGANPKEEGIKVNILEKRVAYRATVQDYVEDKSEEIKAHPFNALVFDKKLDSGKKYVITYKVVSHFYKGAKKTMIVYDVEDAEDGVVKFDITPKVKENLAKFNGKTTNFIAEKLALEIGFQPPINLIKAVDYAFHTPLQFNIKDSYNRPQLIRGTLDTLIVGESRIGKAQRLTSNCLTPTGWKQFKDLSIGDEVINGSTGVPVKITEIHDFPESDIYRVTFTDNTYADCHANHEWTLRDIRADYQDFYKGKIFEKTIETKNLKEKPFKQYYLPELPVIDFKDVETDLHPYILGVLIGGACYYRSHIHITIPEEKSGMLETLKGLLDTGYTLSPLKSMRAPKYSLVSNSSTENKYTSKVKELGLFCTKPGRFIPKKYFFMSYEHRKKLWLGLMDCLGDENNGKTIFTTSSTQLAKDMQQLSLSLGYKATLCGPYSCGIYLISIHKSNKRFVRSVDYLCKEPSRCISIDDPKGLYITDNYIITHNSATTKKAVEKYGLGQIISLAGKSATINGLIGGSSKVGNSDRYSTRAGVLPMNHKGLVVLEELGKASADLMRELTDIRSSNRVRITRVDNTIDLPCMLRMIYLTNPKSKDGEIQSIQSYPDGVEIVTDLVHAPEDIARFDMIYIIGEKGCVDFTKKYESSGSNYTTEDYRDRIKWVWSRQPKDIIITDEADNLLRQLCNMLNKKYDTHIKIFGTELLQKVARIAVAIAGYTVSTDENYEKIIVQPSHISEAIEFFEGLYNNDTFKMETYVNAERAYSVATKKGLDSLQSLFNKRNGAPLIYTLDRRSTVSLNELMAASGTTREELLGLLQPLLEACMIKFAGSNNQIRPTEKYRLTSAKLNKDTRVRALTDERGDL